MRLHFHGDDVSVANRMVSLNPTAKVSSDSRVAMEGLTSAFSRFQRIVGENMKVDGLSKEPLAIEYWGVGVVVSGLAMNLIALSIESFFLVLEVFKTLRLKFDLRIRRIMRGAERLVELLRNDPDR